MSRAEADKILDIKIDKTIQDVYNYVAPVFFETISEARQLVLIDMCYNMGINTNLSELKVLTGHKVTMLGNIPPRDVLANGSETDIEGNVKEMINGLEHRTHVIASCGGGMPPGVTSDNLNHFVKMIRKYS